MLAIITHALPSSMLIAVVLLLLVTVYVLWAVAVHRQKVARRELEVDRGAVAAVWHEGICPVCLALYTANQLGPRTVDVTIE